MDVAKYYKDNLKIAQKKLREAKRQQSNYLSNNFSGGVETNLRFTIHVAEENIEKWQKRLAQVS